MLPCAHTQAANGPETKEVVQVCAANGAHVVSDTVDLRCSEDPGPTSSDVDLTHEALHSQVVPTSSFSTAPKGLSE